jgi:hypothetical protein
MVRGQGQVGELVRRVLVTPENQRDIGKLAAGRDATLDIAVPERASLRIDLRIVGHDLGVDPTAQFIGRHLEEDVQQPLAGLSDRPEDLIA